jgi:hypothetical protein
MILVEGIGGATAGCTTHVREDKPAVLLVITDIDRISLSVRLEADAARLLATSLARDSDAIEPYVKMWSAENEERILNPTFGGE